MSFTESWINSMHTAAILVKGFHFFWFTGQLECTAQIEIIQIKVHIQRVQKVLCSTKFQVCELGAQILFVL
jgi:hypothetical protein